MLQNAYLLAKIGADTAENEQHFAGAESAQIREINDWLEGELVLRRSGGSAGGSSSGFSPEGADSIKSMESAGFRLRAGAGESCGWCPGAGRASRHGMRQTLQGSFSAVTKRNFARKYAFESSRRDLHNALLCTALQILFFVKNCQKSR